ncbi:MAG: hypothetical protein AMXMBFR19_23620 [Chthonomonadaceae bacterium]|uniref:Type II site-specific deoxyribonuclease BsobI n=1 Tax=Candidatus Nitrosymbiomonas proteolyticus TaxID=2608984 RepID=A0A809RBL1_9BACT|nr:MAG: type II site-specific deoxyribonuclease BsobI [Armatimonadetes bacterium OLB18]BBO24830.1 type II site-specific deoxyribonuclease BsobI [Candidatus Nitrosymbiomonas proteolyticus]
MLQMWVDHVKCAADLRTELSETIRGFEDQIQQKTKKAAPYLDNLKALVHALATEDDPYTLYLRAEFRSAIIAACLISNKSAGHLVGAALDKIVEDSLVKLKANDPEWKEVLVSRAALTWGDALGGSMRNLVGQQAEAGFLDRLVAILRAKGLSPNVGTSTGGKVNSVSWGTRIVFLNRTCGIVRNNIDAVLTDATAGQPNLDDPSVYIACGELKGGIDPAGADEHWKTARTALDRIRDQFKTEGYAPKLFFVGAAIESAMADEIFQRLKDGLLSHAANLTKPAQVTDLCEWLIGL